MMEKSKGQLPYMIEDHAQISSGKPSLDPTDLASKIALLKQASVSKISVNGIVISPRESQATVLRHSNYAFPGLGKDDVTSMDTNTSKHLLTKVYP